MEDKEGNKLQVNDIWEVIYTQRAIRYWSEEPIPRELIEKIIEAASKAPSGSTINLGCSWVQTETQEKCY